MRFEVRVRRWRLLKLGLRYLELDCFAEDASEREKPDAWATFASTSLDSNSLLPAN
jgi:hypothetical protein